MSDTRKKIFVVEDDPDVLTLIQNLFAEKKISASYFNSSQEGLKEIIKQQPNLVIIDLMMPGISGFEVTGHIRKNQKLKHIAIMVITGYDSPRMRNEIFSYGIDDYLPKPFDIHEFLEKVNRFL
ncbi:MAG: response regulator transcription factor [Elusimicrobiota bacterium]